MIEKVQDGKMVYSDGMTIEAEMLSIARNYAEEEIPGVIAKDARYLINNTFSPVRRNLLEWYPFRKDCTILEVGAGMGSLTGLLCDKAKHVTSVEMSKARAQVIEERYKKRKNLTVCSDDILTFDSLCQFDYIVMVGVLEYAAIFSNSETPFHDFLAKLKSMLKPDGILLFAIANQYGLKYWLGGSEEHLQKPFVGIQGYKEPKTAKTFSKTALEDMCKQIGFNTRFYYLLPDYKFPTAIFTDDCLPTYHDVRNPKYAYAVNSCLTANERELYRDIIQNGVFPFFANAYLVEASCSLPEEYIIRVSARSEVVPESRILTTIDNRGNVFKIPQTKEAVQHIRDTYHNEQNLVKRGVCCIESDYNGDQLKSTFRNDPMANEVFSEALEKGDYETVKVMINSMEAALRASSDLCAEGRCNTHLKSIGGAQGEDVLEHGYMDMTFYNAFWIDRKLHFFDQEWVFEGLPVRFILYYGLKICYEQAMSEPRIPFAWICDYIRVTDECARKYDILEQMLWENQFIRRGDIYGADGYYNQYGVKTFTQLFEDMVRVQNDLVCREGECQQLRDKENRYLNEIASLHNDLVCREGECQQPRDKENRHLNEIASLRNDLVCREGECQQLRDKENRYLNEIASLRNSRAYRLGNVFARIARVFVPKGSKRAALAKMLVTMVRHPKRVLDCFSKKSIRKALLLLRRGDMKEFKRLLRKKIYGIDEIPQLNLTPPDIVKVDMEAEQKKGAGDYPVLTVPQWENPTVSIVIPVYNQFEYTYHCVESILKNSGDITYEILVGNDCSTDLTTQIDSILSGVKCITNEKNLRFVLNCKNAAKYAKGKYLLFLNNDTQVQENWLEPLITLIESADDIGMVGSKLIYPDGFLQEAGGILWRDGSAWNYGNRKNPSLLEFNYVKEVDYISGAAIMLPRALWEEIGGFDEAFVPAYCDDSDLAFTVRKKGYRVLYQPKSVVVHFEGVSNGTNTASGQKQYQIVNSQKFYQKWKDELAKHPENGQNVFQARDRSYDRKTLLMVDHYVPQYDKDAGSRTVFQYLKLFVGLGFNVKFIGDNFFQHEPYTSVLQQMGIEVLYGPDYAAHWEDWIRENGEHIDYAFLNRPHIAPKYMDAVRRYTNAKVIYYGHDLGFLREMREYEVTGDITFKESSLEWQPKELALMRRADMAYYPSYVEVDAIHAIDPEIRVKAIPAYLFDDVRWEGYDFDDRKDIMFIGGFSHRPNIDAVKWLAKEILPELVKRLPEVKIHILGSNAPQEVLELASENFIIDGFVTDEQLMEFYHNCRISLVPLRFGAGIKGKVVEAMRYGTPVVTTTTGAEGIPNAEAAMLIEDDAKILAQKLAQLYMDSEKLTQMSQNCVAYVQNNYSFANAIKAIGPEFDLKG